MTEALVAVAVLALLGTASVALIRVSHGDVKVAKLQSDVNTLNRAVSSYLGFAGSLDEVTESDEVLAKLKTRSTAESARKSPGLSGSFVDSRIKAVYQNAEEAAKENVRAYWDPATRRFVLASSGPPGIKEFILDDSLAETDHGEETRSFALEFNSGDGWIWSYQDRPQPAREGPTIILTTPVPDLGIPPANTGSGPLASTPVNPGVNDLATPEFSLPAGPYSITDYKLAVSPLDLNPSGAAQLIYSLNYTAWQDYTGSPIEVAPNDVLQVQAIPKDPTLYGASSVAMAAYQVDPATLLPPVISLSSGEFTSAIPVVDVSIANPNDPELSRVQFRVNGGAWTEYAGAFSLNSSDYPAGAAVESRAEPVEPYWLTSPIALSAISGGPQEWPPSAFHSGIYAVQEAKFNSIGTAKITGGVRVENGNLNFNSIDNLDLQGDLSARAEIKMTGIGTGLIDGDIVSETKINLESGIAHNGSKTIGPIGDMPLPQLAPPTGPDDPNYAQPITFIEGDYSIDGSFELKGTLYATGSIRINSGSSITGGGALVAGDKIEINSVDSVGLTSNGVFLYSLASEIRLNSIDQVTLNGVLYAPSASGKIVFNSINRAAVSGGIYCGAKLEFNNLDQLVVGAGIGFKDVIPEGIESWILSNP